MQGVFIENNPPFVVIVGIWWSMTWRVIVWLLAFLILLFIFQFGLAFFLGGALNMGQQQATAIVQVSGVVFGWCAGFAATCVAIRKLIGLRFGRHRLLLVRDGQ
jgi:hypothetical protein